MASHLLLSCMQLVCTLDNMKLPAHECAEAACVHNQQVPAPQFQGMNVPHIRWSRGSGDQANKSCKALLQNLPGHHLDLEGAGQFQVLGSALVLTALLGGLA